MFIVMCIIGTVISAAKRHLLSEDVIKLQNFQQRKLAVAHLVTGHKGDVALIVSKMNFFFVMCVYA